MDNLVGSSAQTTAAGVTFRPMKACVLIRTGTAAPVPRYDDGAAKYSKGLRGGKTEFLGTVDVRCRIPLTGRFVPTLSSNVNLVQPIA